MKVKTITYSQSKESANSIGLKSWVKIGVEVDIEEGDSPDDALKAAKEQVEKWHKESNPTQYFEQPEQLPIIQEKER